MGQKNDDKDTNGITDLLEARDIKSMIYTIRGQQVMLDSDLAMLYQVETGVVNRAVKRNKERFPEDFCFQLTEGTERRGGRRYMPYVFTELGVSMLSSILRSDVAVFVSIGIMRAFVEMRHFIANNTFLFEKVSSMELKQLEYQKSTDERFDKIEDFNIILKTGYNLDGNRLICAHLFDFDPKTNLLLVDNTKSLRMKEDNEFVYRIQKTQIKCIDGWNGLRKHILWTMGRDTCWTFWGDAQFGEQNIISLERKCA